MIRLLQTNSSHPDFRKLVQLLDADLADRDGAEHAFYAKFNKPELLRHAVVAYTDGMANGCGAVKKFEPGSMEVKRMYTNPSHRGQGIAGHILHELEKISRKTGCTRCVLETGRRQPEAIAFYKKNGYKEIPNYGQYAGVENSVCFEKILH